MKVITIKESHPNGVQLIHVGPHTVLSPHIITNAIQKAYNRKLYAKFYTDKYFIQVNFAWNGNISVSSNIRNQAFLQDLYKKNQEGWNLSNVKSFCYQWMQISRRTLY